MSTIAWVVLALLVVGCGSAPVPAPTATEITEQLEATQEATTVPESTPVTIEVPEATTGATHVPEATAQATEMPEYRWSQLLDRDDIRPIYNPKFVAADEADYSDDELVMGAVIAGEAKAYPIGVLNRREMVNDELAGIPILVTF